MSVKKYLSQPSPETKIWRYMDLAQFMSLIHTGKLFFCQVKRFEDSYEGSMRFFVQNDWSDNAFYEELMKAYNSNGMRVYCAATCWHINNHESAAMWKLYLSNNQGIAVQSSVERLEQSLQLDLQMADLLKGAVLYTFSAPSPKRVIQRVKAGKLHFSVKDLLSDMKMNTALWYARQN